MSKLDTINPTVNIDGEMFYDTQFYVEGEQIVVSAMTKEQIIKVAEYIDEVIV